MGNKNNRKKYNDAIEMNEITYLFYYRWLKLIALNVFKWENLPTTVDIRYLELTLFERGMAVYFEDDVLEQIFALPVNLCGRYDMYGVPVDYKAWSIGTDYHNDDLDNTNSVLIWNNYLRQSGDLTVQLFARRLMEIDRTIDVNINAQKKPVVIECSEQQRLTMENEVNQVQRNENYLFIDSEKKGRGSANVWNVTIPYVADKLETLKHSIFNDFLSCIGVENSNEDKKERMVADEVQSGYGLVEVDRNIYLSTRQQAVEKINKMFPQDIPVKVSFNSDVQTLVNQAKSSMGIDKVDSMEEGEN